MVSMKVIHKSPNAQLATIAVDYLKQEGIEAYIWDENASGLYPMFNPEIGMIRIAVDESDAERAEEALTELLQNN